MGRVGVAVQKAHRHAFDVVRGQGGHQRPHRVRRQRRQHFAGRVHALRHGEAPPPRHQGGRPVDVHVVLFEAVLQRHLQHVAVPFGGDEGGARSASFDEGVGGQGGAVQQHADVVRLAARRAQHLPQPPHHAGGRLGGGGEHLGGHLGVAAVQNHIRERAANIHGDAIRLPIAARCRRIRQPLVGRLGSVRLLRLHAGHRASSRTTRKPELASRWSTVRQLRTAERTSLGALLHEPPRCTRLPQSPARHAPPLVGAPW